MKKNLGMLCHVSSIPSVHGIGDFGKSSIDFIDFLSEKGFNIWQILPINKTNDFNCPYSSVCYFALDEMYVSPEELLKQKLIDEKDICVFKKFKNSKKTEYKEIKAEKIKLLEKAFKVAPESLLKKVQKYTKDNPHIEDYAIFISLLEVHNIKNWRDLPAQLLDKNSTKFSKFVEHNARKIEKHCFFQYILHCQWQNIMKYARKKKIKILGDLPVYPDANSYDVYANPEMYKLDKKTLLPKVTGGVPADDFCADGQNWETCIYNWPLLEKTNFEYMITKIGRILQNFDLLRIDHFPGYVEHYEVNGADPSKSKWVKNGGAPLFEQISQKLGMKHFVIEDLGNITKACQKVKAQFDLKGMKVLQFIMSDNLHDFDSAKPNNLFYLGTHDNNTFMGFLKKLTKSEKQAFCKKVGIPYASDKKILISSIKKLLSKDCDSVVLQLQDMLMQDESQRMNTPGRAADCWEYKAPLNYKKKFNKMLKNINLNKN